MTARGPLTMRFPEKPGLAVRAGRIFLSNHSSTSASVIVVIGIPPEVRHETGMMHRAAVLKPAVERRPRPACRKGSIARAPPPGYHFEVARPPRRLVRTF